ncbi:MAG TPA: CHRD domain-containing protein [Vicinamibacterales bacterium]|nr:CHRD domain-containing protein [Vicinamibacterales bacterium]
MRATRTPFLAVILALVLAVSAAWAQDNEPIQVFAILNGGDIAPEAVLTGAFAIADLTIDPAKGELTVILSAFNLPTGVSGAHIHVGSPGLVGPVLFDLRPNQRMAGDVEFSATINAGNLTTSPALGVRDLNDAFQALIGLAAYIDIHTEGHGDGEVRGWLMPWTSDSAAARTRRMLLQTAPRR